MSNYNSQLQSNNTDLQTVLQTLQTKAAGSEQATPVISVDSSNGLITATAGTKTSTHQLDFQPAKTITPSATSQIAVSSGYYTGGNITVAAVPTQTKNVTPKATSQNVTPDSGKFLSKVTVAGDSNLVAGNIKSGVSIFGVSGTLEEGGGTSSGEQVEWSANEDAIISRGISGSYFNDRVTSIGSHTFNNCIRLTTVSFPACTHIGDSAFYNCASLTTVSFPACTHIGYRAFVGCRNLITVSFPACTSIGGSAFNNCIRLTTVTFPACTHIGDSVFYNCASLTTASFPACADIGGSAFYNCTRLTTVTFPACTHIGYRAFYNCASLTTVSFPACREIIGYAFMGCTNLKSLYLTGSNVCELIGSNAFSSTPIGGYSTSAGTYGSIYVPASLLTSYQTATNWTYFSSRFVALGSEDNNNLITFTIEGTEYQAEDGMTWGDWVNSEYNTGGFYIGSNDSLLNSNNYAVYDNTTEDPCRSYKVIRPNEEYV